MVLRSTLFNLVMFVSGALFSLYGLILKDVAPERLLAAGKLWARLTVGALQVLCDVQVEVAGREYLPKAGGAVIAAQHQSAFDTLIWMMLLPRPSYVLKAELLKLPLMGPLLRPCGFIPVDRAGGATALRQLVVDCRAAIKAERQIVIFPEGTRVAPGDRGALLPGVVAVAQSLNLPVLPVATDSGLFWGRKAFKKYPGVLRIKVYPPIPAGTARREVINRLSVCFYESGVDNSVEEVAAGLGN